MFLAVRLHWGDLELGDVREHVHVLVTWSREAARLSRESDTSCYPLLSRTRNRPSKSRHLPAASDIKGFCGSETENGYCTHLPSFIFLRPESI